ncbi:Transcription factor 25 [Armadillidium nasatum]|uniref:Transcription factor 25 n=1 Tax=Armadillidium nasatum TaxID=96803 RepID=A0A5N5T1Q3_9CRUS|nr:Transcription factor 25 [Armadillidium nasatum]
MSLRAIRKFQEKQRAENSKLNIDDNDSSKDDKDDKNDSEKEDGVIPMKACNRFDLLIGDSHSESEAKEDDDLTEVAGECVNRRNSYSEMNHSSINNPSGARKKRKKKKKRLYVRKYPASSEDQMDQDIDEVEKSVREVNALLGEAKRVSIHKGNDEDKGGKSLLRRNQRQGSGTSRSNRGTWIVQGQPYRAQHSKPGISMVLVESTPSYNLFKFQHNTTYQQTQFKFLEAVESFNPDNILNLLHREPFHVDTLLQVSEIFRLADDSAMSAQLIERAIFVMESVAHPLFNVTTGNSRLNFKQQENRGFFVAIFRHIINVGLKGCYRTALELCKLLLSLSPDDDPMAVSLMLDFYALRAREYAWLVALYDLYEPSKNLSMISKLGSFSEVRKRADEMLQKALIMFPGVVKPLLEKCNVQPDIDIDSHPYFGEKAQISMNRGLSQIVNLYVGRNFHVWKEAGVINWLEENFKIALGRVNSRDPLASESEEMRKTRYQGTPTAIYRHIYIAEVNNATATLPPSLANTPVMSYDPLPPHDSICDYARPKPPSRPPGTSSSILASFFRGFLPNYDPNAPDPPEQEEEGAAGGAGRELEGAGAELRASVTTLLEAMRNLFSNINLTEHPAEDADRSEEDDDDDDDDDDEDEEEDEEGAEHQRRHERLISLITIFILVIFIP